ncbi:MAG TPA: choice-of-anchor tandem repeat GloVer-containing protein [Candidatus Sulfotelmatobacter sp.]|nr:choice-of-anchor tandem repeat GloVer-containing protein [Candidatus Sulfotelmatobacter sp.]
MRKLQDSAYFVTALTVILAAALTPAYGQTFSVLYNFGSKASDTYSPAYSGVIAQGRDRNLYGTAPSGGAINGNGAVLKITPAGVETVIYSFDQTHGSDPLAA